MKRFTETGKWNKAWFQDLSAKHKLLWLYLCDNCDCAGFWSINWRQASFQIGIEVSEADMSVFSERVVSVDATTLHIVPFIEFQYGHLSAECKAHIPILKQLKQRVSKGYPMGLLTLQEKEKEIVKGKEPETTPEANTTKPKDNPSLLALECHKAFPHPPTIPAYKVVSNVAELLESGYTASQIREAITRSRKLGKFAPQSADALTDPARFQKWLTAEPEQQAARPRMAI